ncbi:MAG: biopolymer transporter ExbD [Phaeodactylibacter sp.]|nr:biopolymer transporter ExbD [Phaeodactylibacter sp.]MCB9273097.1 biopolymer transporter ExbD [Lewinellaceae bacterium]
MFHKPKHRQDNAINAGSMADIAFLLLIFFLVTTTILVDTGIAVRLPPWTQEPPPPVPKRNILWARVNANDELLVGNTPTDVGQLRQLAKDFIMNPSGSPNRPKAPNRAVISLQHDRATSYEAYLAVYNELMAAYNELWDEAALQSYGRPYKALSAKKQAGIRAGIPLVISEAEPVNLMAEQ